MAAGQETGGGAAAASSSCAAAASRLRLVGGGRRATVNTHTIQVRAATRFDLPRARWPAQMVLNETCDRPTTCCLFATRRRRRRKDNTRALREKANSEHLSPPPLPKRNQIVAEQNRTRVSV